MPTCDVCNKNMTSSDGCLLSTSQVATSETYWEFAFAHQWSYVRRIDQDGDTLAMLAEQQAAQSSGWLVCEACSKLFSFDRHGSSNPPDVGPANLQKVALAAAKAWNKMYGEWPSSIKVAEEVTSRSGVPNPSRAFVFGRGFRPSEEQALLAVGALCELHKNVLTPDHFTAIPMELAADPATDPVSFLSVVDRTKKLHPYAYAADAIWVDRRTGQSMAIIAVWEGAWGVLARRRLWERAEQNNLRSQQGKKAKKWWRFWK